MITENSLNEIKLLAHEYIETCLDETAEAWVGTERVVRERILQEFFDWVEER